MSVVSIGMTGTEENKVETWCIPDKKEWKIRIKNNKKR